MPFRFATLLETLRTHRTTSILSFLAVLAVGFPIVLLLSKDSVSDDLSKDQASRERMSAYMSLIELDLFGQAHIQETFTYQLQMHQREGIVRALSRRLPFGNYLAPDRDITFVRVERNGAPESITPVHTNRHTGVQIGTDDESVTGAQSYRIEYRIARAALRTDEKDIVRLTPTDRTSPVPMDAPSVTVQSPVPPLHVKCYVAMSVDDAKTSPCNINTSDPRTIQFQATRSLTGNQQLFIELEYPRGTFSSAVPVPSAPRIPAWALIVLAHLLAGGALWLLFGRDSRGRGVIIPNEELLADIPPYEAGALLAQGASYASFVGLILDLAERGVIKFTRTEAGSYLLFDLERIPGTHVLDDIERAVLHRLFQYPFSNPDDEEMESVRFGKHSAESEQAYALYETLIHERFVSRGWYASHILTLYSLGGCILIGWTAGLYLLLAGRIYDPYLYLIALQIPLLLPILSRMPRLTKAGALARERIQGLAWYIRVAEKDRLAFHENPEAFVLKPGKLLAYAVAMGIQKDWQTQFISELSTLKKTKK